MNLIDLINSLQQALAGLAQQVSDTQAALTSAVADAVKAAVDPLNQQISDLANQLSSANSQIASLTKQVSDLQAQLAAQGSGGGFSQSDVDAAVKAAVDPLNSQIADLKGQLAGVPDQIKAGQDQAISDFKSQLAAAWANEQVGEAQFAALFAVAPPAPPSS